MASSGSFNTNGYEGRYLTFAWSVKSQSTANNTTTISWSLKGGGDAESSYYKAGAFKVVIDGKTVYSSDTRISLYKGTTVASGTYTMTHNTEGAKSFKASVEGGIYTYAVNCTGNKTWDLPTIARKSSLSASNGTLGTAQTLTVSRQSSSFTHTIKYTCGSASGTVVTKSSSTSISFTPPLSLASQNTTGTSVSVKFTITTYSGSTSIGSNTKTITCSIPSSVKPSCKISVSDASGYSVYVKGYSKFKITVTPTTSYGSAIASYSVKANGATYTTASVTTAVLASSGSLTITATVKDKRGRSGSASVTVTAYDKSSLTASNGTLDTSQTLTINRSTSKFTHNLTYTCGTASGTIASGTSDTSISFKPALSLASQNTTGTSVSVTLKLTTLCDGKSVGSVSKTITCTIPSAKVKPSCGIELSDSTSYYSTYGAYVKGLSKFKVKVTPTLSYDSAIASYTITANGSTYTKASFTTEAIKSSGTLSVTAKVKDKRGNTSDTASESATVLDYANPAITKMTAVRCNQNGTTNRAGDHIKVTLSSKVYALDNKNTATYKVQYKKSSATSYTSVPLDALKNNYAVSNSTYIFEADINSSYDVIVTVTDNITDATITALVSTGFTTVHYKKNGRGVGFGKVAELDDVLDIGFKTRFFGGIDPIILDSGTDFNTLLTPNIYVSSIGAGDGTTSNYVNCPIFTNSSFSLEVIPTKATGGNVMQRLTTCSKGNSRKFERHYHSVSWGEWSCVYSEANTLLASPNWVMSATQTVTLSEPISKQPTGIVLVFSRYEDSVQDDNFHTFFISKKEVALFPGCGHSFPMFRGAGNVFNGASVKYLYIDDTTIRGHSANDDSSGTGSIGITYNNSIFVLRRVIGV